MSRSDGDAFPRPATVPFSADEWALGERNGKEIYRAWRSRNPAAHRSRGAEADERCFVKGALGELAAVLRVNPGRRIVHRIFDRVATYGIGDLEVDGVRYEVKAQFTDLGRPTGNQNVNSAAHRRNPGRYVFAIVDPARRIAVVTRTVPAEVIATWPEVDYGYGDPCYTKPVREILAEYGR